MRTTLIAAVSALLLMAGSAGAEMGGPGGATTPRGGSPGMTPAPAAKQPIPDPTKQEDVLQIKGAAVYGSDGKKIGNVSTCQRC